MNGPLALLLTLAALPGLQQARGKRVHDDEAIADKGQKERYVERVVVPRETGSLCMELSLVNPDPQTPMLVLLHGGRSSRGEFRPIVPRLRQRGYNCLAVDLSPGAPCREVENLTAKWAYKHARKVTLLDGQQDLLDALTWARGEHAHGKIVVWGGSFSASLALVVAAEHPELVDGVVAFTPGEYFAELGKSATWVRDAARQVKCPVLVGGITECAADWTPIHDAIPEENRTSVVASSAVARGLQVLWPESAGNETYWTALEAFLTQRFPAPPKPAGVDDEGAGGESNGK